MQKNESEHDTVDYVHWLIKGWLNPLSKFNYDHRVNRVKAGIARLYGEIMGKYLAYRPNNTSNSKTRKDGIGFLARKAYYLVGRKGLRGAALLAGAGIRLFRSSRRRKNFGRKNGLTIPTVLVVSVTMACNYDCLGCYSRGRPDSGELSKAELSDLFNEAHNMGLLAAVLTGGEPLMRDDILDIVEKQSQILFVLITNGSLMTPEKAAAIGRMKNLVVLVSIEGSCVFTDERRGDGAHQAVLEAMAMLKDAGAFFGFAATNNTQNSSYLGSDEFIDDLIERGCSVGLITEYLPCGQKPRFEWVLNAMQREQFRQRILKMMSVKPIVWFDGSPQVIVSGFHQKPARTAVKRPPGLLAIRKLF